MYRDCISFNLVHGVQRDIIVLPFRNQLQRPAAINEFVFSVLQAKAPRPSFSNGLMCLSTSGNYTQVEILTGNRKIHQLYKALRQKSNFSPLFPARISTCV